MTAVTATINRTPFRPVGEIPVRLLASDKLKWYMPDSDRVVLFTTDGKHFGYEHDVGASSGLWRPVMPGHVFRPVGMTWEAAKEAVCAATTVASSPPSPPQSAQQPKAEEPFRPGLPPAELRAVCKEWEWRWRDEDKAQVKACDFVGDRQRFLNKPTGSRKSPSELATSIAWGVGPRDFFRPLGRTWADVEAAAKAVSSPPPSHLPKDGDEITVASAVAVVKEGCCQALDELLPSYETLGTLPKTRPVFTVITSLPRCRRKYVKIFLKSLGFRNVDKIPTTTEQKPYYMSLLSTENREKLISLAPGIVLRDVL